MDFGVKMGFFFLRSEFRSGETSIWVGQPSLGVFKREATTLLWAVDSFGDRPYQPGKVTNNSFSWVHSSDFIVVISNGDLGGLGWMVLGP